MKKRQSLPQLAELIEALIEARGGPASFVKTWWQVFDDQKTGSPAKARMLCSISDGLLALGDRGLVGGDDPAAMTDEEIEREFSEEISKLAEDVDDSDADDSGHPE